MPARSEHLVARNAGQWLNFTRVDRIRCVGEITPALSAATVYTLLQARARRSDYAHHNGTPEPRSFA